MSQEKEEPVYVMDETAKNATPAGMISRSKLAEKAHTPDREEAASDTRVMVLAVVGIVVVVVLGLIGIVFNGAQSTAAEIEAKIAAERAAAPGGPDDIQGVKVRRGMQHEPNQPTKRTPPVVDPDDEEEDEEPVVEEDPAEAVEPPPEGADEAGD